LNSNISNISHKYLAKSGYIVDATTLDFQLQTHPDFPSFRSISDTFDYFRIENIVANVPKNVLEKLPKQFLTILTLKERRSIYLVKKKNSQTIQITDEQLSTQKITVEAFLSNWDGSIIAIAENVNGVSNQNKFSLENISYATFALLSVITLIFAQKTTIIAFGILNLLGAIVGFLILKESLGIHNKTVAKVCGTLSKESSCDAVINSQNSKMIGNLVLSDLVFVYFAVTNLILLLLGYNSTLFLTLTACSLPVIALAVYSQAFVIKKWCALCLVVAATLFSQFLIAFLSHIDFKIEIEYLLKSAIVALVGVSLFYFIKTLWIQKVKLSKSEVAFLKFKRDKKVFATLLQNEKIINANLLKPEHKINFGPTNAKAVIDAVTNPLCGFCVEAFNGYYDLLKNNHDIQVNFIFNVPPDVLSHPATQIVMIIVSIYENQGEIAALEAMKDWYSNRSLKQWQAKYGIVENEDVKIITILKQHGNWINVNDIHYTPATVLNGFKFPDSYELIDLRMLIDDLEPINHETDLVTT
jgi:uncharacterized membrane protein